MLAAPPALICNYVSNVAIPAFLAADITAQRPENAFHSGLSDDRIKRAPKKAVEETPAAQVREWKRIAAERLARLNRLPAGWDGAGSFAISLRAIQRADRILDLAFKAVTFPAPPAAVPCGDGSVQLEWWLTDARFELTIEPDGSLEGWAQDRITGHQVHAAETLAIELLSKWASRLTADKLVPVT